MNKCLHRNLCEAVITALHKLTAPKILLEVHVHTGQLVNEEADTEAEKGDHMDTPLSPWGTFETCIQALPTVTD